MSDKPQSDALADEVREYLDRQEENYNQDLCMLGRTWVSPGYHSSVPTGAWVHATRDTLYYAAALVYRDRPGDLERATAVVRAVIGLQDQDPTSATYGIWSWMYEQPLAEMSPPDWNWADFCGNALLTILKLGGNRLDPALYQEMRESVRHAALAIFRRNVRPAYTNIAIMGGVMASAAGEILGENWLLEYGRARLHKVVGHLEIHGDFTEYNSPTYTMVALEETERGLYLVADRAVRDACELLRRHAWNVIADHFHPATSQWAGPHSRAYSDYVLPPAAKRIGRGVNRTLDIYRRATEERSILDQVPNVVPELPCPEELLDGFAPTTGERIVSGSFWRPFATNTAASSGPSEGERRGYTWIGPESTLATVNADSLWTQRRGVIGYWALEKEPPAVFRVRALKDGRDFASMAVLAAQQERTALVGVVPAGGLGDYHVSLDSSPNGCYQADRLVVRFSVTGPSAEVRVADDGYRLIAGAWQVIVRPIEALRGGTPVGWTSGASEVQGERVAFAEVPLFNVPSSFCPEQEFDTRVGAVIRLQHTDAREFPDAASVEVTSERIPWGHDADQLQTFVRYKVGDLDLKIPRAAAREPNP